MTEFQICCSLKAHEPLCLCKVLFTEAAPSCSIRRAFLGFSCCVVDTLLNLELLHIYASAQLRLFWQLSAHLCSQSVFCFIFFAVALCASMHDWLVCACMYVCVPTCVCVCVYWCVRKRKRIGMSSLSCLKGSQSLFKLPSGFQASHLQTGISCSLLLSLSIFVSLSPTPPCLHVCPRLCTFCA